MDWLYEERPFTQNEQDSYGFVYYIEYECGKHYIGMKTFAGKKTLPAKKNGELREGAIRIQKRVTLTEEELLTARKGQKSKLGQFDVVFTESDWKTYEGSSKLTVDLVIKTKHIMHLCPTKRNMSYMEVKMLFMNEVLEDENFINDNILGKFFKDNLV